MPALIIALILILGAGGTVAASQNDLPGDALFGVKLATERVQAGLKLGAESRIEFAAKRGERRLEEIEKLQDREKTLDADAKASVEENFARFENHAADARARLMELQKNNPEAAAKAGAGLEIALARHKEILARLKDKLRDTASARLRAEQEVEETEDAVEGSKSGVPSTNNQESAEGKINAASKKVEEVEARFAELQEKGTVSAEAQAQLALAKQQLANARGSLAAANYNQAFLQAKSAMKLAVGAQVLLEEKDEGEDEVR